MANRVGQQLGNYRLIRLLGEGGFSEVYLGEHLFIGRYAAIKLLKMHLDDPEINHFRREAQIIASLRHPHIVSIHDFGIIDGVAYLIMDYAPNGTLRQRHPRGQRVGLKQIIRYAKQVASALQYAHDKRIVHRDVKPANMLLGPQDEILLSDFGIAVVVSNTYSQSLQDLTGTPAYMAPEQIEGKAHTVSDQYALAIIIYEWLCGSSPYREGAVSEMLMQRMSLPPTPLHEKVPDIPLVIEQVVLKALARNPSQRFGSIQEFVDALEQVYLMLVRTTVLPLSLQTEVDQPLQPSPLPHTLMAGTNNVEITEPISNPRPPHIAELTTLNIPHADPQSPIEKIHSQRCPFCGAERKLPTDDFCLNCGKRLMQENNLPVQSPPRKATLANLEDKGSSVVGSFLMASPTFPAPALLTPGNLHTPSREMQVDDYATILMPSDPQDDPSWSQLLENANAHFNEKRYNEALPIYEQVIQLDAKNILAYVNKGHALLELGRYEEALVAYDSALTLNFNDASILAARGNALSRLKRYDDALYAYDRALQQDAKHALAYANKGHALLALGRYKEALAVYENYLVLIPDDANIWVAKGNACFRLKQNKKALDAYDHAGKFAPDDAVTWTIKGNVLARLKRYDEALNAYDHALVLLPEDVEVLTLKGNLLSKLKFYEKALEAYDRLLTLSPHNGNIRAIRGNVLSRLERFEDALADYEHALAVFPKRVSLWEAKGEAFSRLGRYDEALAACDRALAFKPFDISLVNKRDMISQLKRNKEELDLKNKLVAPQPVGYSSPDIVDQPNTLLNPFLQQQTVRVLSALQGEDSTKPPGETKNIERFDVFLSHSHVDAEWVEKVLAKRLEDEHGLHVWLDKWLLIPGMSWQQEMARGLDQAGSCAVCIGERTPVGWFREEIERALNRQTKDPSFRVIPVLLPDAKTVNVDNFLELRTWVDFRNTDDAYAFHLLVCGVKGIKPGRPPVEEMTQKTGALTEDMLRELNEFRRKGLVGDAVVDDYVRVVLEKIWITQWLREMDNTHE